MMHLELSIALQNATLKCKVFNFFEDMRTLRDLEPDYRLQHFFFRSVLSLLSYLS